jgi:iron(III) transport system permease protein
VAIAERPAAERPAGAGRAPAPWAAVGAALALLVAGPLLALPASFVSDPSAFGDIASGLLPEALEASAVLAVGVAAGTLLIGGSLAALVSFYDFPGRRWLDWALVLPLAMPAYVLVFVLLGQYDASSTLQQALRAVFGDGFQLPEIRSAPGAIAVLTLVLYPYVYVLGRAAFLDQSRETFEAARTLGQRHAGAIRRVALPMARPALAAGAALAVMEALADFGAVNLLNYRAMTDAIYRVWYGAFDQTAALQLATLLVSLTLSLVAVERLLRGRARYHGALIRGEAVVPRRLRGARAAAASAAPVLLLLVVVGLPLAQLVAWSIDSAGEGATASRLVRAGARSVTLAVVAAAAAVVVATILVYGRRKRPSRLGGRCARV